MKKFFAVIGNPPYQETTESDSTRMPPIYNYFMDESYKIAEKIELITPARFLFNAGYTPKEWNEKMLNDEHLKVQLYEADCTKIFPNTEIKGGIAITYRDAEKIIGPIGIFTKFKELNTILEKVKTCDSFLDTIIYSPLSYQLSDVMKKEHPELISRLRTSAFSTLSSIFFENVPKDKYEYVGMDGLESGKRKRKFIRKDYIKDSSGTLKKWKLLVSKANGSGVFGETLSKSIVSEPENGYTQTFIAIGAFNTKKEAEHVGQYIKTKFVRALLGVLKITQDNPGPKWKYVPLQDFTSKSDIDWTKSVHEIDLQLYKKYGLSKEEKDFIETHVKEMV